MTKADLPQVMAIEPRAYSHHWSEDIFKDSMKNVCNHLVVMHDANQLLGYAVFNVIFEDAQLLNITVAPEFTGKGLGHELLDYVIRTCGVQGAESLYLEVRPSNAPANRLYESKGFKAISIRKNYYPSAGGREDGIVMGLRLIN